MEEWFANLLTQVPLAIAILLIWYLMDIQQSKAEDKRETNRAADNAAQNKTVETLLQTSISFSQSVNTLAGKVDRLVDHTADVQTSIDTGFDRQLETIEKAAINSTVEHGKIESKVDKMDMKIDEIIVSITELQSQMASVQERMKTLCDTDSKTEQAIQQILVELAALNAKMTKLIDALTEKQSEPTPDESQH